MNYLSLQSTSSSLSSGWPYTENSIGAQNGDVIEQLVGKYPFAHLFLNPADGGYILNSNRKPITLEEALGVDAHKLELEQARANEAAKQERIEAAREEGGFLGKIKLFFYEHTDR